MELPLFSRALGKQCYTYESRCRARNTPPSTFDMFHRHTAKQGRLENSGVPRAGWVLGHGWGCSAANLGDRCRRVYGFLGIHSPKGLGTSETLFAKKHCGKSPVHGGLCLVATPGGEEMKLCPFLWTLCGLFL